MEATYQPHKSLTQGSFNPSIPTSLIYAMEGIYVRRGATSSKGNSSEFDMRGGLIASTDPNLLCTKFSAGNTALRCPKISQVAGRGNWGPEITEEAFAVKKRPINQTLDVSSPSHSVGADFKKPTLQENSPATNMLTEFPSYLPPPVAGEFGFSPLNAGSYETAPMDSNGQVWFESSSGGMWGSSKQEIAQGNFQEDSAHFCEQMSLNYAYDPRFHNEYQANPGPMYYYDPRQENMIMLESESCLASTGLGTGWPTPHLGTSSAQHTISTYSMTSGSYTPDVLVPAQSYDWSQSPREVPSYASRTPSLESCHSHSTSSASNPTTPSFALPPIEFPEWRSYDHERLSRWFSDQSKPENFTQSQKASFVEHHSSPTSTSTGIVPLSSSGSESYLPPRFGEEETLSTIRHSPFYRKKVLLACYFCRRRKMACTPSESRDSSSCAQCLKKGVECEYPKESRRGQHRRKLKYPPITPAVEQLET